MRTALILVPAVLAGLMLLLSVSVLVRPIRLILSGKRVKGVVTSEHLYRMYGIRMRFYRVVFPLSTGQEAQIRSSASKNCRRHPQVGSEVPVLVSEAGMQPRACIATWSELWLGGLIPLFFSIMLTAFAALGYAQ
jgi:hypothetical protein